MQPQVKEFLHFTAVEKGYSENTVAAYRNDLNQFLDYLKDTDISSWQEVSRAHIQDYVLYLKKREYASSTTCRKIAAIKSFFHFLVAEGVLQDDPVSMVNSPSVDRPLPRPLSSAEVERLFAELAGANTPRELRDRALLELLYATGMRASEVVELKLGAVDLDAGTVRCIGKGNKERILPLYERARKKLRTYLEKARPKLLRGQDEASLFVGRWGRPLTRQGLWLIVKKYALAAELDHVTPHTLRHTFATHLLNGGAGLREVQHLLGHASISTTQIYTKVSDRHKREAYDKAHPRA